MHPNALLAEIERQPFQPLRLHLADGRTIEIDDPDVAVISNFALYLFKIRRQHRRAADDTHVISLRHIVSFEPIELRNGGPKGKGRKSK